MFYSTLDFANCGISLYSYKGVEKPPSTSTYPVSSVSTHDNEDKPREEIAMPPSMPPMYIENPVERDLNVSQNVTAEVVEAFRIRSTKASKCLEDTPTPLDRRLWGVALLCASNHAVEGQHVLNEENRKKLTASLGAIFDNN